MRPESPESGVTGGYGCPVWVLETKIRASGNNNKCSHPWFLSYEFMSSCLHSKHFTD